MTSILKTTISNVVSYNGEYAKMTAYGFAGEKRKSISLEVGGRQADDHGFER